MSWLCTGIRVAGSESGAGGSKLHVPMVEQWRCHRRWNQRYTFRNNSGMHLCGSKLKPCDAIKRYCWTLTAFAEVFEKWRCRWTTLESILFACVKEQATLEYFAFPSPGITGYNSIGWRQIAWTSLWQCRLQLHMTAAVDVDTTSQWYLEDFGSGGCVDTSAAFWVFVDTIHTSVINQAWHCPLLRRTYVWQIQLC